MSTQILTGSRGVWCSDNNRNITGVFTVTMDTCSECSLLPVKFDNAAEPCSIKMSQISKWLDIKTQDFQGA